MSKLREKTTATLLIAILMISTFAVAVSARLYDEEQEGGKGTVELVDTIFNSETHSAKLMLPEGSDPNDEARIKFNYDGTLGSITGISYFVMTTSGYYATKDQYLAPYITLEIDANGDGEMSWKDPEANDVWLLIAPYHDYVTDHNQWFEGTWDDNSYARIKGCLLHPNADEDHLLSVLKGEIFEDTRTWGELDVLRVKVGIGTWLIDRPEVIAYVDDVTINAITYDMEPTPNSGVSLENTNTGNTLTVNVDSDVGGSVAIVPLTDFYADYDIVTLTANPIAGWQFHHWSGDVPTANIKDNPLRLTMDSSRSITAHFVVETVSISVTPTSVDFGDVLVGEFSDTIQSEILNTGNVDVTVTADVNSAFYEEYLRIAGSSVQNWLDNPRRINAGSSRESDLSLDLRECREAGDYAGELVFWAQEAGS